MPVSACLNANALIDSTGLGDVILADLKRRGLRVEGYKFTNESKRILIDNLILYIAKAEVTFPEIKELIDELELFEYDTSSPNIKYSAPAGFHDDFVISLGLALQLGNRKPFICRDIPAQRGRSNRKSIFDLEREFEKTGDWSTKH